MKNVTTDLSTYLANVTEIMSCDLYELELYDGTTYRYNDSDVDLTYNGNVYYHNKALFKRDQIKLNSTVVVDTLSVTVTAGKNDLIQSVPVLKAAHDGILDRSYLRLKRAYFRNNSIVGVIDLFGGNVEIKNGGGLQLQLTVKAKTQGLNMGFPIRKYYPQGMYTVDDSGKVISSANDATALIAPFIPRKEVLM